MEINEKLKTEIGTKEPKKLAPEKVIALSIVIESVKNKKGEEVGDKATLTCKHPDQEDPIKISNVKYEKGKNLKVAALWYNLDEDQKIFKNSALAIWMKHNGLITLENIEKMELETTQDDEGYLVFKAY